MLSLLSLANAAYTFLRKRQYRLFESPIEQRPTTPSATRVRVASPPCSSSPLRLLQTLLTPPSATSRAHPDATRDVWELGVWDPLPMSLRLFCLFSPGHALVYLLFLPIGALDPRPSVSVATMLLVQLLLTAQLLLMQASFAQQARDTAVVQREVLHEYDTKFVHPTLHPIVRDVGTQFSTTSTSTSASTSTAAADADADASALLVAAEDVTTYPPTTILRRGFTINPNPNYASHISPDNAAAVPPRTPNKLFSTPAAQTDAAPRTPLRAPGGTGLMMRQPQFRPAAARTPVRAPAGAGDGGSLGVYSHAKSPLKKASSAYESGRRETPRNGLQAAAREIAEERERGRGREVVGEEGRERRRKTFL